MLLKPRRHNPLWGTVREGSPQTGLLGGPPHPCTGPCWPHVLLAMPTNWLWLCQNAAGKCQPTPFAWHEGGAIKLQRRADSRAARCFLVRLEVFGSSLEFFLAGTEVQNQAVIIRHWAWMLAPRERLRGGVLF